MVTRVAYEYVNGFLPLVSGGDRDFCQRVIAAGNTDFHYCPEIKVFHPARGTIEEIKKKFSRVSKGIAVLNFQKFSRAQRLYFICKQILGLFFQPHQVRQIVKTFVQKGWQNPWAWRFAIVTWQLGLFTRYKLIRKFIELERMGKAS